MTTLTSGVAEPSSRKQTGFNDARNKLLKIFLSSLVLPSPFALSSHRIFLFRHFSYFRTVLHPPRLESWRNLERSALRGPTVGEEIA